jgi:uncharacterized membrane protein (UPF0182 family)
MDDDRVFEHKLIDATPRKRRTGLIILAVIIVAALFFGSQFLSIYIDALWFSSVGYSSVYWYKFKLGGELFGTTFVATFAILWMALWALGRVFPEVRKRPNVKLSSIQDIREINLLPYVFRPGMWIVSIGVALMFAVSMSQSWPQFALYLHSAPSGASDPIFHRDISFYLFTLPVLQLISEWAMTISVIILVAVAGVAAYVWYVDKALGFGVSTVGGRAVGAASAAISLFGVALAFSTYLSRFDLLQGRHELFSGVSYTDDHVQLPGLAVVIVVLLIAAAVLLVNAAAIKRIRVIWFAAGAVVATWIVATVVIPQSVYSFSVKPNELAKESPYIQHNIQLTREAFGLDQFEERAFQPATTLTPDQLQKDTATLDNIRLWDPGVLKDTLAQIQEIRQYYDFKVPDIDRYVINGKLRQVMLSARELNANRLPEQSKTWINQHIVYTHGYGVAMSTVNEFTHEGLPHLVLKDMPVQSDAPEMKVTRPEIYFGEETNLPVYVHTKPQGQTAPEFNYPAVGNTDSYTEYEGQQGVRVGGVMGKIPLSLYFGDGTNLIFSDYIGPESRVLFHRNILDRVNQIAPFLLYDKDPYIVIGQDGRLSWIIDAYTYSSDYPFSASYQAGGGYFAQGAQPLNYIRNSVKAVVDAYQGTVTFYVFDPKDPIVSAYQGIFPELFRPAGEMPPDIRAHVRYPNALVSIQSRAFTLYHMQNPQTFYNHEDLWAVATSDPDEPGSESDLGEAGPLQSALLQAGVDQTAPAQHTAPTMRPYYVLMTLPGENGDHLEFVNILPFTPAGGRSNMIGWLAGRSDGTSYGHALVFSFPKNVTVTGPAQVRARFSQDATLSAQITLWNQNGSKIRRGNLLVIPIADSLLYVEPFFLQASNSPLPELRQVALATEDRMGAGATYADAIKVLFPQFTEQQAGTTIAQSTGQGQPAAPSAPQTSGSPNPKTGTAQPNAQPAGQPNGNGQSQSPSQSQPQGGPELAKQANQLFDDYRRLTSEGKYKEAGEKLDQLKQTLDQMVRPQAGR